MATTGDTESVAEADSKGKKSDKGKHDERRIMVRDGNFPQRNSAESGVFNRWTHAINKRQPSPRTATSTSSQTA